MGYYYITMMNSSAPAKFGAFMRTVSDSDARSRFVSNNMMQLRIYAGVTLLFFAVYWFLSDRTFSFLLTVASMTSLVSFLLVLAVVEHTQSSEGLSVRMLELYLVSVTARLVAIVPYDGYLPYDSTGDWLYPLLEACILLLVGSSYYSCRQRFADSSDEALEKESKLGKYLLIGCFLAAILIHPSLNRVVITDIAWAYSLYLESVATLPQLLLFQRTNKIQPWTCHFLGAQTLARVFSFMFWLASFTELHDDPASLVSKQHALNMIPGHQTMRGMAGWWALGVQAFQLLLMADFGIQYARCLYSGTPVHLIIV